MNYKEFQENKVVYDCNIPISVGYNRLNKEIRSIFEQVFEEPEVLKISIKSSGDTGVAVSIDGDKCECFLVTLDVFEYRDVSALSDEDKFEIVSNTMLYNKLGIISDAVAHHKISLLCGM